MASKVKIAEFNEKYNLKDINLNLFDRAKADVESKSAELAGKPTKTWQDVSKRFFSNKWNVFFVSVFVIILFMSIIVPAVSRYSANNPISGASNKVIGLSRPSWAHGFGEQWRYLSSADLKTLLKNAQDPAQHIKIIGQPAYAGAGNWKVLVEYTDLHHQFLPFGTDSIGRDVWTKLWQGTFWSLRLAFLVAFVETVIGVSIGIYLGMNVGRAIDTLMMRVVEIFNSIPPLVWMIVFSLIIGTSFWSIALVLILVGWVAPLFQARMFTIKVKDAEFIKAARVSGTNNIGILYKHIFPNVIGRLAVGFVLRIPAVIFFEASLVFLGFTVGGADGITLGNIVNTARAHVVEQPWDIISASFVILTVTVSLHIIANGLRDALDAKVSA